MNIQDLGSIGELVAALATLLTLGYLAIQLKQNTSALKSQTFQQSSMDMSLTANSVSSDGELAKIIIKAENGMASLNPDEIEAIDSGDASVSSSSEEDTQELDKEVGNKKNKS